MRRPVAWLLLLQSAAFAVSCISSPSATEDRWSYEYRVPDATTDGWEVGTPSEVGLDREAMVRLMEDLHELDGHQIHSILVVRNGRLVFEEYFPGPMFSLAQPTGGQGFDRDDTHNLASVTKSFTSTLVGIAIDKGFIPSLDTGVFDFFPEHADLVAEDSRRGEMTVEDLLLMKSGILWNDLETYGYDDPRNDLIQMWGAADPIRFALSRELYVSPGTDFEYCNANTNILGEIVHRASGQRLSAFSDTHLFGPLGVTRFEWQIMPDQVVFASGDLRLRPRDMAKLGELFLSMGEWEGAPVVSREWVEVATTRHVHPDGPHDWADGYGYGWWHWDLNSGGRTHQVYFASGWGGQWIVVVPEHDMVVVSTAGNYHQAEAMPIQRILTDYLLPR